MEKTKTINCDGKRQNKIMVLTMRSTKNTEELPVYSFEAVALKIGEYLLCSS